MEYDVQQNTKEIELSFLHKMSLRHKFIAGLVLSAFILGVILCVIIFYHFNSIMEKEISQRSKMLLDQAGSVQEYVRNELRPEMFGLLHEDKFVLKAMSSSYISRKVMENLDRGGRNGIYYRRVAINARNPIYEPTSFENQLIKRFQNNKSLQLVEEDSEFRGIDYHLVSVPVTFKKSCMACHGNPQDAPKDLIDMYGDKKGFFHKENDVGGVVVAGFPVRLIKDPVNEVTIQYLSLYLLWLLLFACIIGFFFDVLVMKNLKKLGQAFDIRFSGEREKRIIEKIEKKDEIEGFIEGIDEIAACLFEANQELEFYNYTLEEKVKERTKKLEITAQKHLSDLSLFSRLIARFTDTFNAEVIIRDALERIGVRYNAVQVVYYCTVASDNFFTWHEDPSITKLSPEITRISWDEKVLFEDKKVYIPVSSHESHWGILCLIFDSLPKKDDFDAAVLLSLGLQLGSSLENIHSVSELKYQNELLQSVFEGISDPLLLIDLECRIIFSNTGSDVLFGKCKSRDSELKKLLQKDRMLIFENAEKNNEPVLTEIKTDDDKYFRTYLYPMPRRESGELRLVMYARDITVEKGLIKGMQQAERLSSIGKMAAGMAHEINNPLGVIRCYADLLSDSISEEKDKNDLQVIINQTRNVQRIVQNLLNFSRSNQVAVGSCEINKAVLEIVGMFIPQGASKNITIEFVPFDGNLKINCNRATLEQIITNIVLNAFDAIGRKGGAILIKTSGLDNEVLLEISDNGSGISDKNFDNIFDPFFTTKEVGQGTGLGLSVVYGFMNELGGRVEVFSKDITVFKLYFPYA